MRTILSNNVSEIIIKNSKFICLLIKIESDNIKPYIDEVMSKYPKATHYCYGYIYNDIKHSSDDGEPCGTAGMPILNVLEKENLGNILCVVVRYFGGIKLGAGGLIRAYTKSVCDALKNTSLINLVDGYKIILKFNYEDEKNILYILNNSTIIDKIYDTNVTYICYVDIDTYNKLSRYDAIILDKIFIPEK